jgi:hypothetical protein
VSYKLSREFRKVITSQGLQGRICNTTLTAFVALDKTVQDILSSCCKRERLLKFVSSRDMRDEGKKR